MRIHIDTDFAGDTDDAAAVAMVLGWPDAELVGITTTADPDGARAGYVHRLLALAGRDGVPVASGAGRSSTTGEAMGGLPDHAAYWGGPPVAPRLSPPGEAVELLAASVERGAVIAAIGPLTNLALLEQARPGILDRSAVVAMGGWVYPPAAGLPPWGPERDWNIQCDTGAALTVLAEAGHLTLATLPATMTAHLRAAHLPRLEASGPIGQLLARQGRAHENELGNRRLGSAHELLPDDLLNFQFDPVACAAALGWEGATTATVTLRPRFDGPVLRFDPADDGPAVEVVIAVDGDAFADAWLAAIERVDHPG